MTIFPDKREPSVAAARLQHIFSRRSTEELRQSYGTWADDYDKDLVDELGYRAHELVAEAAARYVDEIDAPMLDIGCGTGLTGEALLDNKECLLHGLDVSPEMLAQARQKSIYDALILADLNQPLAITNDTYAGAISSGTFTHGHVRADALSEISRVLQPGAPFAFTVHSEFWEKSGFPDTLERLESEKEIKMIERQEKAHLAEFPDKTSFVCVVVAT